MIDIEKKAYPIALLCDAGFPKWLLLLAESREIAEAERV
jgi:hypothetical protein